MRLIISILFIFYGFSAHTQRESPQNTVVFRIKNFGVTVEGFFSTPTGIIYFDGINLANSVFDVTINTNSVNTGIKLRDIHLRKAEYFDVDIYPKIKFKSTSIVKDSKSDKWIVTGDLTIKNITKQISFPFVLLNNVLVGKFTLNRRMFNVGGKNLSMGDDVSIELNVPNQKL